MKCIILGDKFQKGMKSKGCCALIKNNKFTNILQNQYNTLRNVFNDIEITYIYGFDNKKFLDFTECSNIDINMIYNEKHTKYSHVFSLFLASHVFTDDILIIDGYKSLDKKSFKKFKPGQSQIFIYGKQNQAQPGCIINKDNHIENFSFDLSNSIADIYYLSRDSAKFFATLISNKQNYNNFVFEILNKMIDRGYLFEPLLIE